MQTNKTSEYIVFAILLVGVLVPSESWWWLLKIPALFIILFTAGALLKESGHGHN